MIAKVTFGVIGSRPLSLVFLLNTLVLAVGNTDLVLSSTTSSVQVREAMLNSRPSSVSVLSFRMAK